MEFSLIYCKNNAQPIEKIVFDKLILIADNDVWYKNETKPLMQVERYYEHEQSASNLIRKFCYYFF